MLSSLEQSILAALVYFDIFEYPLTLFEIHRYLLQVNEQNKTQKYSLNAVREALAVSPNLGRAVRFKNGWFFLRGRDFIIRVRSERQVAGVAKYRRAKTVAKIFSYLPFVRLVAVCNSLAYGNARPESDIDLFIITKQDGVWWARFFTLLILKTLRLRPGQGGFANKICLSFFVDQEHLDLEFLQAGEQDTHLALWLAAFYPLYDAANWHGRLWQKNLWLKKYLIQARPVIPNHERYFKGKMIFKYPTEWLLSPLAGLASWAQLKFLPVAIQSMVNADSRVRIDAGLLKFHTNDRRAEYNAKFQKQLVKVLNDTIR